VGGAQPERVAGRDVGVVVHVRLRDQVGEGAGRARDDHVGEQGPVALEVRREQVPGAGPGDQLLRLVGCRGSERDELPVSGLTPAEGEERGLVGVGAHQQRQVVELAARGQGLRRLHEQHAVGDHARGEPRGQELLVGRASQAGDIRAADRLQVLLAGGERLVARGEPVAATAALDDGLVEQLARPAQVAAHREAAGGLAEEGHVAGVAAERRGVGPHPLEGQALVEQAVVPHRAVVGLGRQLLGGEEPERAEPVVRAHHHDAFGGQVVTLVVGHVVRTLDEAAAVDPDHDRQVLDVLGRARVQAQAVRGRVGRDQERRGRAAGGPRASRARTGGVEGLAPRLARLGRAPGPLPHRRFGVRDGGERPDTLGRARRPAHRSERGVDHQRVGRGRGGRRLRGGAGGAGGARRRPGRVVVPRAGRSEEREHDDQPEGAHPVRPGDAAGGGERGPTRRRPAWPRPARTRPSTSRRATW